MAYDNLNRTDDVDGLVATYLGVGQNEIDTLDGDTITRALPGMAVDDGVRYIRTPSGQSIGIIDGTDTYWLISDRRGSITGITNSAGVEIVEYAYTPFCQSTTVGARGRNEQRFGMCTSEHDPVRALLYAAIPIGAYSPPSLPLKRKAPTIPPTVLPIPSQECRELPVRDR